MPSSLRRALQADLPAAMKSRDTQRLRVLRIALSAIANAEAVDPSEPTEATGLLGDVARRPLTDGDVRAIVARERDEMVTEAARLRELGRSEADGLAAQAAVLDGYLASRV